MKKIISIVVFIIGLGVFAQYEETFQKANTLYNQEKYQEAIDAYTSILDSGKESAATYYNLGNAHYKLSNIGPSVYYYEKALVLSPNDTDIKNNLVFAQNATIDAIDVIPEGIISKSINNFTNRFTFDGWAWISVGAVIVFVILFMFYHNAYVSIKKRLFFIGCFLTFLIVILCVFFAYTQYNFIQDNQFAIVFSSETTIKSEPNLRSDKIFELHEGTKVKVLETVNDWKRIRLADGKIGWIPAVDIKEI